ncbi:hypothetical protein BGX24_006596, partial [Mortierella sp. AD032]
SLSLSTNHEVHSACRCCLRCCGRRCRSFQEYRLRGLLHPASRRDPRCQLREGLPVQQRAVASHVQLRLLPWPVAWKL